MVTYLGAKISPMLVSPQKVTIRTDGVRTLNDMQKLLGDINWIRPYLHIPNSDLKPLFDLLKGDPDIASHRRLTPEARAALQRVEKALGGATLHRIEPGRPFDVCLLQTSLQPTAVIWQKGPLLWIHPKVSPAKVIEHYPEAVASLALEAHDRAVQHFGSGPQAIRVPYTASQIKTLAACIDTWAILRCVFHGDINNQYPKDPILSFVTQHPIIFPKVTASEPLVLATTIYTDGSKTGIGAYVILGKPPVTIQFEPDQPQVVELQIVKMILERFSEAINIVSDSRYVVNAMQVLETAGLIRSTSTVAGLFLSIQTLLQNRHHKVFTTHIRAHTSLPGPMAQGNAAADTATRPLWIFTLLTPIERARAFHDKFHVNARTLANHFHVSRADARDIVRLCDSCATYKPAIPMGVNPRGLIPGDVWQMDITHIQEFGTLKYVHVSTDTCSHVIFATAETGEKVSNVINHCLAAWAAWGKPKILKTDNGPAYIGKAFNEFCKMMEVQLKHGIPYNPQGQGIIERAHRSLKEILQKQKGGVGQGLAPKARLSMALFTHNFLNLNNDNRSPAVEHCNPSPNHKGWVKWKDVLTGQWMGPDPVVSWNRGAVCVFPQEPGREPLWIPERLTRATKPSTEDQTCPTGDPSQTNQQDE